MKAGAILKAHPEESPGVPVQAIVYLIQEVLTHLMDGQKVLAQTRGLALHTLKAGLLEPLVATAKELRLVKVLQAVGEETKELQQVLRVLFLKQHPPLWV